MNPSPANALEFCLGSLSEMTEGDIYDMVDHYSRQGKLAYIHFRNVRGKVPHYHETFVDEVRRTSDALVLATIDNEREQTPMPAMDQAVDQLSTYLLGLPRRELEEVIHDAAPLARVFPALRQIGRAHV